MTVETAITASADSQIDRGRIKELTDRELKKLADRTPKSAERYERAVKVMPGGVPSSFQENDPWPVYIERGARDPASGTSTATSTPTSTTASASA